MYIKRYLTFFHGVIFLIFATSTSFYIYYATQAWFFQDDFTFLIRHMSGIEWSHLITLDNFGRFVTRDIYWYLLSQPFGLNPLFYFLFNLCILGLNSVLVYYFLRQLDIGKYTALMISAVYYISLPAVVNFYWISNSQHIIAHTFILLFILYTSRSDFYLQPTIKQVLTAIIIFLIGCYSNVLTIFVVPYILFNIFIYRKNILHVKLIFFYISIISISFWFVIELKRYSTNAYNVAYTLSKFLDNIAWYISPYHMNVYGFLVVLMLIIFYNIARKYVENIKLIILGCSFYIPFSFAASQHYHNYLHLTSVFLLAAFINTLLKNTRKQWINGIVFILLIYIVGDASKSFIRYMLNDPLGKNIEGICQTIKKDISNSRSQIVYLKVDKPNELPTYWWILGFGDALKLFVDPNKEYKLSYEEKDCMVKFNNYKISEIKCK